MRAINELNELCARIVEADGSVIAGSKIEGTDTKYRRVFWVKGDTEEVPYTFVRDCGKIYVSNVRTGHRLITADYNDKNKTIYKEGGWNGELVLSNFVRALYLLNAAEISVN